MDYEKKYNEALKWMRELYPGLHGATKEDAEHFFPELRESEDERIRKEMIAYFAHRADVTEFIDEGEDCKRWISYLEKQKEQKPAEWSEWDEGMLNCCISSIEEAKENRYAYNETDGDTSYDREIAFLSSLRPSWKPSDEQMKALEIAFRKDGDDKYRSTINSLYNDLKKL